jgi:hypothetical protein
LPAATIDAFQIASIAVRLGRSHGPGNGSIRCALSFRTLLTPRLLAAVLWNGGISSGDANSLIFADLIILGLAQIGTLVVSLKAPLSVLRPALRP